MSSKAIMSDSYDKADLLAQAANSLTRIYTLDKPDVVIEIFGPICNHTGDGRKAALRICGVTFPTPSMEISERMPSVEVQENAEVATNVMRLELVYEAKSLGGPYLANLGCTGLKW
jgi:hypothetical protein